VKLKIINYNYRGLERVGLYVGDEIVHLSRLAGLFGRPDLAIPSIMEIMKHWGDISADLESLWKDAESNSDKIKAVLMSPDDVEFLPPITNPPKNIMCMGLNYKDHVEEGLKAKDVRPQKMELDEPIFFTKSPSTLIGHNVNFPMITTSEKLDYEGELAFIIGKSGKNISKDRVYDHIFGYCCSNDLCARDIQRRHKQLFKGKTLDFTCPIGPFLVPKEFYQDPMNASIKTWVNGEIRQDSNTKMMIHDIPSIVSVLSEDLTLEVGDIIMTGTPSGVGYARDVPSFLEPGDVVEVEVENLGKLRTEIVNN